MSQAVDNILDDLDKGRMTTYQAIEKIADVYRRSGMSEDAARSAAENDVYNPE